MQEATAWTTHVHRTDLDLSWGYLRARSDADMLPVILNSWSQYRHLRASRLTTSAHSGQRFRSPFFKPSCSMTFCVGRIRNEAGHATGRNRKPKIHHSHRLWPFFAALEDGARAQIAASNRYRGRRRKRSIGAPHRTRASTAQSPCENSA